MSFGETVKIDTLLISSTTLPAVRIGRVNRSCTVLLCNANASQAPNRERGLLVSSTFGVRYGTHKHTHTIGMSPCSSTLSPSKGARGPDQGQALSHSIPPPVVPDSLSVASQLNL